MEETISGVHIDIYLEKKVEIGIIDISYNEKYTLLMSGEICESYQLASMSDCLDTIYAAIQRHHQNCIQAIRCMIDNELEAKEAKNDSN